MTFELKVPLYNPAQHEQYQQQLKETLDQLSQFIKHKLEHIKVQMNKRKERIIRLQQEYQQIEELLLQMNHKKGASIPVPFPLKYFEVEKENIEIDSDYKEIPTSFKSEICFHLETVQNLENWKIEMDRQLIHFSQQFQYYVITIISLKSQQLKSIDELFIYDEPKPLPEHLDMKIVSLPMTEIILKQNEQPTTTLQQQPESIRLGQELSYTGDKIDLLYKPTRTGVPTFDLPDNLNLTHLALDYQVSQEEEAILSQPAELLPSISLPSVEQLTQQSFVIEQESPVLKPTTLIPTLQANLSSASIPPPPPPPPPSVIGTEDLERTQTIKPKIPLPIAETPRNALLEAIRKAGGKSSLKSVKRRQSMKEKERPASNPQADLMASLTQALKLRRKGIQEKEKLEQRKSRANSAEEEDDWK